MRAPHYFFLMFAGLLLRTGNAQHQDINAVEQTARSFIEENSKQFGRLVSLEFSPFDSRLKLKQCDALTAHLPLGSKSWGKINIIVKCAGGVSWQIYVPATVTINGNYYVTSTQLKHGQTLTEKDLIKVEGSLNALPNNPVFNLQEIQGKSVQGNYAAGTILRNDMVRAPIAIQQGQVVKIISSGPGFSVSTEATALNTADVGQIARGKTSNGQVITGIAKLGAIIEIQN